MKRKKLCAARDCDDKPVLGGLCAVHAEQKRAREELRSAAVKALHTGAVDGSLPKDSELRSELLKLREWWDRACESMKYNREDDILQDEAEAAGEWCIRLAQEVVLAERAASEGLPQPVELAMVRNWVWERFANLEAGMMSNGVKRRASRD